MGGVCFGGTARFVSVGSIELRDRQAPGVPPGSSANDNREALPPAAVVSIASVRSVANRWR
jgi:hypothetical protein